MIINYNKLHADQKQGKSLDISKLLEDARIPVFGLLKSLSNSFEKGQAPSGRKHELIHSGQFGVEPGNIVQW